MKLKNVYRPGIPPMSIPDAVAMVFDQCYMEGAIEECQEKCKTAERLIGKILEKLSESTLDGGDITDILGKYQFKDVHE